jgi:hypothetical protein
VATQHNLHRLVLPLLGVRVAVKTSEANDHEIALRQVMERVVMAIDNAKFIKRNWVTIEWATMHWVRPAPGGGQRVTEITPALREAIRVALVARGYQVRTPLRLDKKFFTTISWEGFRT